MAGPVAAVTEAWDKLTVFLYSQLYDERNWAKNKKLANALGLFAGSILFMRTCGGMVAI